MKKDEILLKRADYDFQDSQLRLSESNSLIKTFLGFSGAIASFAFYTKVYDALFLISWIAIVFGLIWLEDQVKMHRKMFTKQAILAELLGDENKEYVQYIKYTKDGKKKKEIKYRKSLLNAVSYIISGFVAFVIFGAVPMLLYNIVFIIAPTSALSILNGTVNPILIDSKEFNIFNGATLLTFVVYFFLVSWKLGLDKKNVS